MRIFISQPMRDRNEETIFRERLEIIDRLKEKFGDVEIVNTDLSNAPEGAKPLWYLGRSLEALSTADVAYFADGWDMYRGCGIEMDCCLMYDIRAISEKDL